MPLCSALLSRAVGTVSSDGERKTAVPGMRFGRSSIIRLMYRRSDTRSSFIARASISRPRCQVVRIVKKIAPTTSGNHPPLMILPRFAAKNVSSIEMKNAAPGSTIHSGFRHSVRNTTNASSVFVAKMALRAIAVGGRKPRRERNMSTSTITDASRNQFTTGM